MRPTDSSQPLAAPPRRAVPLLSRHSSPTFQRTAECGKTPSLVSPRVTALPLSRTSRGARSTLVTRTRTRTLEVISRGDGCRWIGTSSPSGHGSSSGDLCHRNCPPLLLALNIRRPFRDTPPQTSLPQGVATIT